MYCGIDLAVKRKTAIGVLEKYEIQIVEVYTNEEIINLCSKAKVVAIDSPLSHSNGFRNVDKAMIRNGYKVLPPSFMKKLVDRAIELSKQLGNVIETHPTSSMKNINMNWKEFHVIKDYVDAAICAAVAMAYDNGCAMEIEANDGKIYLLKKSFPYRLEKVDDFRFRLKRYIG